jgi:hypothetical protein
LNSKKSERDLLALAQSSPFGCRNGTVADSLWAISVRKVWSRIMSGIRNFSAGTTAFITCAENTRSTGIPRFKKT